MDYHHRQCFFASLTALVRQPKDLVLECLKQPALYNKGVLSRSFVFWRKVVSEASLELTSGGFLVLLNLESFFVLVSPIQTCFQLTLIQDALLALRGHMYLYVVYIAINYYLFTCLIKKFTYAKYKKMHVLYYTSHHLLYPTSIACS